MSSTKITIYNSTTSSYQDLSAVFLPLSSGTQSSTTTYFTVSGSDLKNIFASISSPGGTDIGYNTNLLVDGIDLRYIFASINSKSLFNTTSGLLTTTNGSDTSSTTLASNFYISSSYSYFNFILYGGGGSGSQVGTGYGTGGGGAGSYISASNIPYSSSSGVTIQKITYTISGGRSGGSDFNTTVTITYSNATSIVLTAGSGQSTNASSGTAGALGGEASFTNDTSASITVTKQNGASGGNEGSNGTSNGYTSSGSGSNTSETAPISNPPTVTKTYSTTDGNSYTIVSRGGGNSQTTYQYGAGGAATPANYNSNATAYRYGVAGCILYWLSQ